MLYPFALKRPGTHLALAPDALWAIHRTELMRWPLAQLHDLRRRGLRGLSFRIRGVDRQGPAMVPLQEPQGRSAAGKNRSDSFRSAAEQSRRRGTGEQGRWPAAVETTLDPRVEPVVLLKGRPGTRFQLLGMVEAKGPEGVARRAAWRSAPR